MLKRLASAKLAAVLIAVLTLLCVVAFIVPQSSHADLSLFQQWKAANPVLAGVAHAVGFDDVFASPFFYLLTALLALNLTLCTISRWQRRSRRHLRMPQHAPAGARTVSLAEKPVDPLGAIRRRLKLWRPIQASDDQSTFIFLDRDYYGFLGSMVLHAGLLILIVGGVVSGLTRFDGRMDLTEGETVTDARAAYLGQPTEPIVGDAYSGFSVGLDSLRFEYEGASILQSYAQMTFAENDVSSVREAKVNVPARWDGKSFLLVKGGHAVRLAVADASGTALIPESVVRLGERVSEGYGDAVRLPDGRSLTVTTSANASNPALAQTQTMRLIDPVATVSIDGTSKTLHPGETADLGAVRVTLGDVRLWNEFAVRGDRGIPVTYTGFAVVLLGTLLRVLFGKKTGAMLIEQGASGWQVSAWSDDAALVSRLLEIVGAETSDSRTENA